MYNARTYNPKCELGPPVRPGQDEIDRTCAGHGQSVCGHAGDVSQDTHWDAYRPQDRSLVPSWTLYRLVSTWYRGRSKRGASICAFNRRETAVNRRG